MSFSIPKYVEPLVYRETAKQVWAGSKNGRPLSSTAADSLSRWVSSLEKKGYAIESGDFETARRTGGDGAVQQLILTKAASSRSGGDASPVVQISLPIALGTSARSGGKAPKARSRARAPSPSASMSGSFSDSLSASASRSASPSASASASASASRSASRSASTSRSASASASSSRSASRSAGATKRGKRASSFVGETVTNPDTGRSIRVGGSTYKKIFGNDGAPNTERSGGSAPKWSSRRAYDLGEVVIDPNTLKEYILVRSYGQASKSNVPSRDTTHWRRHHHVATGARYRGTWNGGEGGRVGGAGRRSSRTKAVRPSGRSTRSKTTRGKKTTRGRKPAPRRQAAPRRRAAVKKPSMSNDARLDKAAVARTFSKKNANRPSPSLSARLAYEAGNMGPETGNDGNDYVISVNKNGTARWVLA